MEMDKIKTFHKKTLQSNGRLMDFSSPKIMGIINFKSDSFYKASEHQTIDTAIRQSEKMIEEGAYVIDLGAMSSRPGAEISDPNEELEKLIPVLKSIRKNFPEIFISVDTIHSSVAEAAILEGVDLINDISGGTFDNDIFKVISKNKVPYILMHMKGKPKDMQEMNQYDDLLADIMDYFNKKIQQLYAMGVSDILIDPGFGFAKNIEQNFRILKALKSFQFCGCPVLAGLSRKSMIWKTLNTSPENALNGTTALNMLALENGADILRVHDVKAAVECVKLYEYYEKAGSE